MKLPSLIGVVHLPPLAGSPRAKSEHPASALQKAGLLAVKEVQQMAQAGFDGVILENFGDTPFYKDKVPTETVASLSVIAAAVRESTKLPIGINILRNAAHQALGVATVTDCQFIRVNVLSGLAATDQGMVEGKASSLLRERIRLGSDVAIFADVHVKHAKTLSTDDLELAIEETFQRAMADAVIISGATTGRQVDEAVVEQAFAAARRIKAPLYIGSGASVDQLQFLRGKVSGVIVSSALRQGGRPGAPLDSKRLREFAREAQKSFRKAPRRKK